MAYDLDPLEENTVPNAVRSASLSKSLPSLQTGLIRTRPDILKPGDQRQQCLLPICSHQPRIRGHVHDVRGMHTTCWTGSCISSSNKLHTGSGQQSTALQSSKIRKTKVPLPLQCSRAKAKAGALALVGSVMASSGSKLPFEGMFASQWHGWLAGGQLGL